MVFGQKGAHFVLLILDDANRPLNDVELAERDGRIVQRQRFGQVLEGYVQAIATILFPFAVLSMCIKLKMCWIDDGFYVNPDLRICKHLR